MTWISYLHKYWHWISFVFMASICLGYLIFNPGIWAFTDSGFYYSNLEQTQNMALSKLSQFSNTDGFSFGFDNSARSFANILPTFYQFLLTLIFGVHFGQVIFYLVYYLITFVSYQKLIRLIIPDINETSIRVSALFATFNPFSLLIISLFSTGYVYALTPLFFYLLLKHINTKTNYFLLGCVLTGLFLLTYPRLVPIVTIVFLIIIFVYSEISQVKKYFWRYLSAIALIAVVATPFIYSTINILTDETNLVENYKTGYEKYEKINYNFKSSFINSLAYTGGFTPSGLSFAYNPAGRVGLDDNFAKPEIFPWHKLSQIFFNVILLLLAIFYSKNSVVEIKILALSCLVIGINTLGWFLSFDNFVKLHKSFLIFLYNDYGFIQFIQVFLFTLLIAYINNHLLTRSLFKLLSFIIFIHIFLISSMTPYLSNFYAFNKIQEPPQEYKKTLFQNNVSEFKETTLFLPYHWIKFDWTPYRIDLNYASYSKYQSLIVPNLRVVPQRIATLYNSFYDNFENESFQNVKLFNLKNLFLAKDVENANEYRDAYGVYNAKDRSLKYNLELDQRSDLNKILSTSRLDHYQFNNYNEYDFSIYPVGEFTNHPIEKFFDTKINLENRPVTSNDFASPLLLQNDSAPGNFQANLEIKNSDIDPNLYLIRITDINNNENLFIQLNQTYSKNWALYFINSDVWNQTECKSSWFKYPLTHNSKCMTSGFPISITSINIFNYDSLPSQYHDKSNYMGNIFMLSSEILKHRISSNNELYIALYFKKQFTYQISIVISLISLIIISIYVLTRRRI